SRDRGSRARARLLPSRSRGSVLRVEPPDRARRVPDGDAVDRVDPLQGGERAPRRRDGDRRRGRVAGRLRPVHARRAAGGGGSVRGVDPDAGTVSLGLWVTVDRDGTLEHPIKRAEAVASLQRAGGGVTDAGT